MDDLNEDIDIQSVLKKYAEHHSISRGDFIEMKYFENLDAPSTPRRLKLSEIISLLYARGFLENVIWINDVTRYQISEAGRNYLESLKEASNKIEFKNELEQQVQITTADLNKYNLKYVKLTRTISIISLWLAAAALIIQLLSALKIL